MYAVLSFSVVGFFTFVLSCYFYCKILPIRKNVRYPFIICFIFFGIVIIPFSILRLTSPILYLLLYQSFYLLPVILLFQGSLPLRLTAGLTAQVLGYISELTATAIIVLPGLINPALDFRPLNLVQRKATGPFLVYVLFYFTLLFFVCLKLSELLKKHYIFMNPKTVIQFIVPLILSNFLGNVIHMFSNNGWFNTGFYILLMIYWILFFVYILCLNRALSNFMIEEKKRLIQEEEKQLLNEQLVYFEKLEKLYYDTRKWNHNFSGHLLSVSFLIEQQKYDDAKEYIMSISRHAKEEENL